MTVRDPRHRERAPVTSSLVSFVSQRVRCTSAIRAATGLFHELVTICRSRLSPSVILLRLS